MKQLFFSLLILLSLLPASAGVISQQKSATKVADEYRPMVVEGRTWWHATEGYLGWINQDQYNKYEVGLSIGGQVEIDGVTWNKVYASHYRDAYKYPEGVCWGEDESLLGYIREADRRIYVRMLHKYDETTLQHNGKPFSEYFTDLFGEYSYCLPMYGHTPFGPELMVYDFNDCDYKLGSLENEQGEYGCERCRFISESSMRNSNIDYRAISYEYYQTDDKDGTNNCEVTMVEGIGLTKSIDRFRQCLFFLPFADGEFNNLSPLALRYVTDKDGNVIYEQEGGTKLWDEMAGVQDVAKPNDGDAAAEWYNLQGIRIAEPTSPGVYITRSGNESRKVVIK